jgi:hypothetical protein
MTRGYIHYDRESVYSPYYPYRIGVWRSPHHAIEDGQDPYTTILLFVSMRRDIFMPMRDYVFVGDYGDLITRAIEEIYIPRMEDIDISSSYIYPIHEGEGSDEENSKEKYIRDTITTTTTVSRFAYILTPEEVVVEMSQSQGEKKDVAAVVMMVYRQSTPIPIIDEYETGTITLMIDGKEEKEKKEVKVYIGKKGSFLLFNKKEAAMSLLLSLLSLSSRS